MFWKQLSKHSSGSSIDISLSFLGSNKFERLLNKYDNSYFDNIFSISSKNIIKGFLKEKLLFFIPKYRKRLRKLESLNKLKKDEFNIGINVQFSRYKEVNKIFSMLKVGKRYALYNEEDFIYLDIYDEVIKIPGDRFVLERYREYFSAIFKKEFDLPPLELPFKLDEAKKTAFSVTGQQKYIVFIPCSASVSRNWDINNFISIAENISKISDKKIVLLGGGVNSKKEELKKLKNFPNNGNIINLFNKTDLETAMHIVATSEYALSVDTSLMHCALIGGAETVCLSTGFTKKVFVEYPKEYNVKQTIFYPEGSNGDIGDINNISVNKVWCHIKNNWKLDT